MTAVLAVDTMLCVRDVARSGSFYRYVLGFRLIWDSDELATVELAGHRVYLFAESPPTPDKPDVWLVPHEEPKRGSVVLVLRVDDCDSAYEAVRRRGGEFLTPPTTPPWGGRRCFLHDPDGYLVEIEEAPS